MRNRKKLKNKILKGLLDVCVGLAILSACAVDSDSIIPLIVCGVSLAYIGLIVIANTRG